MRRTATMTGLILTLACATALATSIEELDVAWAARSEGVSGPTASTEVTEALVQTCREAVAASPDDLGALWRLMRALYFHGRYTGRSESERQQNFSTMIRRGESGLDLIGRIHSVDADGKAKRVVPAVRDDSDALHIYFYQAVAWGEWALAYGKLKAVRKGAAGKIRRYAEVCRASDPGMEEGGPARILGRLYHQTPRVPLITGWASNKKAMRFLREAVEKGPDNLMNRLFLAELLLEEDGEEEAGRLLDEIVATEPRADRSVEDADTIEAAKVLMHR